MKKTTHLNIRITPEIRQIIKNHAKKMGTSQSNLVTLAIMEFIHKPRV